MAFIPIDAKADIQNSKKGKMTPAQHSQLSAWCLSRKTGILNCLGVCSAKNTNLEVNNNIATVVFSSGYIVICGRLVYCEEGTTFDINTINMPSGKIILRYDLSANGEEEFKITTTNTDLRQDDLNENSLTGVYEFELYSYSSTLNNVVLIRDFEYIKSIEDLLKTGEIKSNLLIPYLVVNDIKTYALELPLYTIKPIITGGDTTNVPTNLRYSIGWITKRYNEIWIELTEYNTNSIYRCNYDYSTAQWSEWELVSLRHNEIATNWTGDKIVAGLYSVYAYKSYSDGTRYDYSEILSIPDTNYTFRVGIVNSSFGYDSVKKEFNWTTAEHEGIEIQEIRLIIAY